MKRLIALTSTLFILTLFGIAVTTVAADDQSADANVALANALKQGDLPLEQGLAMSSREGKAISAKYELEDDDADELQLSIYTEPKDGTFSEVIIDYGTGKIAKVTPITEGDDLAAAKSQSEVMAQAKRSLEAATVEAVRAQVGYRAVSVMPDLRDGHPVAKVTLVSGTQWKTVNETLE